MIYTNVDTIVRKGLLETSRPIHFYAEDLFHSCAAIRELSFDTLKIINSANLPVGDYGEINLPDDYVDDLSVCLEAGGRLSNLPKQSSLSPIRCHNTDGEFEPYTTNTDNIGTGQTVFGLPVAWGWYWNYSDYGEPTGRFFGRSGGTSQGYQVFKERRQIQLTGNFIGSNVILLYISDGQSIDNASQIDTQAIKAIQAWNDWKRSPNRNNEFSPEGKYWLNQKRILRARLNDTTIADIKNIMHNAYRATLKT